MTAVLLARETPLRGGFIRFRLRFYRSV